MDTLVTKQLAECPENCNRALAFFPLSVCVCVLNLPCFCVLGNGVRCKLKMKYLLHVCHTSYLKFSALEFSNFLFPPNCNWKIDFFFFFEKRRTSTQRSRVLKLPMNRAVSKPVLLESSREHCVFPPRSSCFCFISLLCREKEQFCFQNILQRLVQCWLLTGIAETMSF